MGLSGPTAVVAIVNAQGLMYGVLPIGISLSWMPQQKLGPHKPVKVFIGLCMEWCR